MERFSSLNLSIFLQEVHFIASSLWMICEGVFYHVTNRGNDRKKIEVIEIYDHLKLLIMQIFAKLTICYP